MTVIIWIESRFIITRIVLTITGMFFYLRFKGV